MLFAIPLWRRTADQVRESLRGAGARALDQGLLVGRCRRIRLLLANPEPNDNRWLLAGTVTRKTLVDAADQLAAERPGLRVP